MKYTAITIFCRATAIFRLAVVPDDNVLLTVVQLTIVWLATVQLTVVPEPTKKARGNFGHNSPTDWTRKSMKTSYCEMRNFRYLLINKKTGFHEHLVAGNSPLRKLSLYRMCDERILIKLPTNFRKNRRILNQAKEIATVPASNCQCKA